MNARKILILLLLLLGAVLCWYFAVREEQPAWIRKELRKWHDNAGEIVFYGRIVDQYGQPVEGVVVKVDAPIPIGYLEDEPRKHQVQTDKDGCFEVSRKTCGPRSFKGGLLSIDEIEKKGYEYIHGADPATSFMYSKNCMDRFNPEKNHPVVFHMRKKELTPTFLFEEMDLQFEISMNESGKPLGYDFIQRQWIKNLASPMFNDEPLVCDFQVKATIDTNNMLWSVVLLPGSTNGGIIVGDQMLYETPQDGYRAQYAFVPDDQQTPKDKYLYLRSRDPAIYTRFEIEYINANDRFFRLSGKSVTNPYGDRNLEQAADLPYEVTEQLIDEARAALRKNKYPAKPDLPKLINVAKEKVKQ